MKSEDLKNLKDLFTEKNEFFNNIFLGAPCVMKTFFFTG